MSDLRYPVGTFQKRESIDADERRAMIGIIADAPRQLRAAVSGLNDHQLDTPYREGGWTVRQVAHHVPDSHLNAYIRLKLALTEERPTIKPYEEARWAELPDSRDVPVEVSLNLLDAVTARWVTIMNAMSPEDFGRTFVHPDHGPVDLDWLVQMYAWHSRHHVAHITSLRDRNGW